MGATEFQQSLISKEEKARKVLEQCEYLYGDADRVVLTISGGTDSITAADVWARFGKEYGLDPEAVVHINTGAGVPQSRLAARIVADIHGLEFIEQGYRNPQDALAVRVINNGWPGGYGGSPMAGGHGLEWANRKDKPMDEVYVNLDGFQVWVSGARKLESKKRRGNITDTGIQQDKPRRAWAAVIGGWTEEEKREYIRERGLPVSEAYLFLGFSAECVACAYDDEGLLTGVDLLSPELGHSLRTVAVWLYQRVRRGDVDLDPKRLCWGWQPGDDPGPSDVEQPPVEETITIPRESDVSDGDTSARLELPTSQSMVGCDPESCSGDADTDWIRDLPDEQLVTRPDVDRHWSTGETPGRFPLDT